jgi:2-keto-4-pentenoate hydratase/2-oxohepta-3-ene-1,7-dioic acid hydratase in catechol pathway
MEGLALIILTFKTPTGLALGIKTPHGVLDVTAAQVALGAAEIPATPEAALAAGTEGVERLADLAERASGRLDLFRDESGLEIGPCVPNPGKIICVGLNYRQHAIESNMKVPETPILFSKFNNALAAPGETIPLPENAVEYDYEAELAVVIGRRARYVSESEALNYVLGYCAANDLSARDLQFRTNQWLLGKALDKFLPVGPYLVTADEVGDPQRLRVRCWLNGELRQDSNTSDMIFSVAHVISYASQYMTLEPGDLISTGTPQGVISGMREKVWLKPGDETVVEVEKLGRLRNVMGR